MNKGICYIICASKDIGEMHFDKQPDDYIISADAGFEYMKKFNLEPDMVLGDFDSLGWIPKHDNLVLHKVEKDDTDSVLAVCEGLERGYDRFVIYGGLGGERFDHSIANIQLINMIAERGGRGYLVYNDTHMTVIKDTSITFDKNEKGIFSVFCIGDEASGVTISGAKYNVEDYTLTNTNPTGASNEFLGKQCVVSVEKGNLLIVWHGKASL